MNIQAPQAVVLPDGARLHLHHGPIDLIIGVSEGWRDVCFSKTHARFQNILSGLAAELDVLRHPLQSSTTLTDPVAKRMAVAVLPHARNFVTPMAAVAGAVADEVLMAMLSGTAPEKAYVNNGGDIAFHLSGGETFDVQSVIGKMSFTSQDTVRGIATSGWRGRSHSLGIADSVTVAAKTAAAADVAATLIANAVDLPGHPAIQRSPADHLSPDSDLGGLLVTTDVGMLAAADISRALAAGMARAQWMRAEGLISQAALSLQGQSRILPNSQTQPAIGDLTHA